jgi:protein O-mannosyl-transferase
LSATSIPTLDRATGSRPSPFQAWSQWFIQPAVLIRVVLYLATLIYLRTALFDYVYDDSLLITLNPWMQSWKHVPQFFTHSFWGFLDVPKVMDYYRPLIMLVFAAVYHLLGSAPGQFHLIAAGMHILATYLVYRLAYETTSDRKLAAFAAGLFGLHPTKVETAAWISGLSDSLATVFFLASMIAYFRSRKADGSNRKDLALSLLFLLLALFSKESAVFAPVLLAVYELTADDCPVSQRWLRTLRSVWPFAVVTALAFAARLILVRNHSAQLLSQIPATQAVLTAPRTTLWYIGKQLCPVGLSIHYPIPVAASLSFRQFLLPCLILVTLSIAILFLIRRNQTGVFFVTWFVLMLAPPILYESILLKQDRYFYLPSVATSIGLAYVLVRITRFRPVLQASVTIVAFLSMAALTFTYESYWDSDVALFTRATQIAPNNPRVSEYFANQYISLGQPENAEAVARQVISQPNQSAEGWYLLGTVRLSQKRFEEARTALQESLRLSQGRRMPASLALATADLKLGKYEEAAQIYRDQIAKRPYVSSFHRDLATILNAMGRSDEAARERQLGQRLQ